MGRMRWRERQEIRTRQRHRKPQFKGVRDTADDSDEHANTGQLRIELGNQLRVEELTAALFLPVDGFQTATSSARPEEDHPFRPTRFSCARTASHSRSPPLCAAKTTSSAFDLKRVAAASGSSRFEPGTTR